MENNTQEILIENFNLSLFKQLIYESLNSHEHLMLEIDNKFMKSLSISSSQTLLKLGYAKFDSFCNYNIADELKNEPLEFNTFNLFVLKGEYFKRHLQLYSELKECNIKIFTKKDENHPTNFIATKIELDGYTSYKNRLLTTFALTSSELMVSRVEDYQQIIDKLKADENSSEFVLYKQQYNETKTLIKNLHKTISTNHSYLEFDIKKVKGINIKDKVFDVNYNEDNLILMKENDINFKIFKSDFESLSTHDWKLSTSQESDKIILMSKIKPIESEQKNNEIIIGCVLTKTNNAIALSNDADDYLTADEEDSFGLDLSEYTDI